MAEFSVGKRFNNSSRINVERGVIRSSASVDRVSLISSRIVAELLIRSVGQGDDFGPD